ncbi:MAG: hypothetical protein H6659_14985 [Ardenticatenaceae bacterium]|nr:hypothetical protein [Anaerolineales bacterium]MCB8985134.1 hypothetical protein [Ardenticatenaceae bacterium]MCB8986676.1 hypothetical protein [Ardenticatenaceae bacterium]
MINWFSVFINSFWIVGLAVLLAAFSYHYWLANDQKQPIRSQLDTPTFLKAFWLSFTLIGIGLAGTSQRIWEIAIWTFFTLLSLYNLFTLFKTN